jgi:hypothetical protein
MKNMSIFLSFAPSIEASSKDSSSLRSKMCIPSHTKNALAFVTFRRVARDFTSMFSVEMKADFFAMWPTPGELADDRECQGSMTDIVNHTGYSNAFWRSARVLAAQQTYRLP